MSRRHTYLYLIALITFTGLAFLTLHPLIFNWNTHGAGYDYFNYHWNFWWAQHALTTPGESLFTTDYVMQPFTNNLGYHALTLAWFPLWALLSPVVGTLSAMNAIIVTAAVLNGFLTFALLRHERVTPALALLGGAALQIAPTLRYFYYNTHINLMDWFWLPALILLWSAIARANADEHHRARIGLAIAFGVALWGVALTDLQFPIFAAFAVVPYGILTLWRGRRQISGLIIAGVLAVGVFAALFWFAGPLPHILRFEGTLAPGIVDDRPGVPIPDGFVSMSESWWEWSAPSIGWFLSLAFFSTLIIALIRRSRRGWFWLIVALPALVIALGPDLRIGDTLIPLPYRLLHAQTNGMLRMPWRLLPVFILGGAVFVGIIWSSTLRSRLRLRLAITAIALPALMISVRAFESAPLTPLPREYALHMDMRADADAGRIYTVLDIPTGAATGEVILGDPRATQLQYFTLFHHQRTINGFISRAPLEHFWYMLTDDPMLSWLGQRRFLEPDAVRQQLAQRITDYPIGYAVIHTDLIGREAPALTEIVGFFNQQTDLLCPPIAEDNLIAYRTAWHPDGCDPRMPTPDSDGAYTIDIGAPDDVRYLGWGWHYAEDIFGTTLRWLGAPRPDDDADPALRADLIVDLPAGTYTIDIIAQAYAQPRTITLRIDDAAIGDPFVISTDALTTTRLALTLPRSGVSQITLQSDSAGIPAQIAGGDDTRPLAIAVERIRFLRRTEGQSNP